MPCMTSASSGRDIELGRWVKIDVVVFTPFAQVNGTLEYPEQQWSKSKISPSMMPRIRRLSNCEGACRSEEGLTCRLNLDMFQPFLNLEPVDVNDIWQRLETNTPHIQVDARHVVDGVHHVDTLRKLEAVEDEMELGRLWNKDHASTLRVTISLMNSAERRVDDLTLKCCHEGEEDLCCICLDQIRAGDVVRRLPCLHHMHAGCAMTVLPKYGSCPLCRGDLLCGLGKPECTNRQHSGSQDRRNHPQEESSTLSGEATPLSRAAAMRMHGRRAGAYRVPSAPPATNRNPESATQGQLRETSREFDIDVTLPPHPGASPLPRRQGLLQMVKTTLSKMRVPSPARLPRIHFGRRSERVSDFADRPLTA